MRNLTAELDAHVVAQIDGRLASVCAEHGVAIPWAIESGSRAWGFPSPDSDYDCRFFYVRPAADYLSPWRRRDVIETPLTEVLDVNGWDLVKAIRLAVKGNATVGEWLRSPLVYAGEGPFAADLLALVEAVADPDTIRRHYLHVGLSAWRRFQPERGPGPLKKAFYALRPAAVLHWLRHHGSAVPPMDLPTLLAEAPPDPAVVEDITALIEAKARTRELGAGVMTAPVARFVTTEFERASAAGEQARSGEEITATLAARRRQGEEVFRDLVRRFAPGQEICGPRGPSSGGTSEPG